MLEAIKERYILLKVWLLAKLYWFARNRIEREAMRYMPLVNTRRNRELAGLDERSQKEAAEEAERRYEEYERHLKKHREMLDRFRAHDPRAREIEAQVLGLPIKQDEQLMHDVGGQKMQEAVARLREESVYMSPVFSEDAARKHYDEGE